MQPLDFTRELRAAARFVVFVGFSSIAACDSQPTSHQVHATPTAPNHDPIRLRAGAREVQIRCALSCEDARHEMTAQQRQCITDPTSTPHHVTDHAAWIALGCCTETAHLYEEACGIEALEACASRWIAECESGV